MNALGRCDVWFIGSSLSLGSTVLTAFDQLRDSQRHPDDAPDRQVPRRCGPASSRRSTPQPHPGDDVQSSTMPSSTMSGQSTPPTKYANDCQKCLNVDPPSPSSVSSSSSSSSSQLHHHLGKSEPPTSTSTTTVMAVDSTTSDSAVTPFIDTDCRLRRCSSEDCCSVTPSPPVSFCAVSSSGGGGGGCGGRCVLQSAASGSSTKSRVVAEIVETERKYVRDLRQIVDVS